MKQKIYISGIAVLLIIFTGLVFKMLHYPGAGIFLTLGISSFVLLFVPFALADHYKVKGNRQNLLLYIVTWLTCFVVFTAMMFKIQHWPFAGAALTVAIPFPYVVFLPVFLYVTSKNRNFNINNTVFVLLLLALNSVFSTLLALNVSRERIYDSYNISRDYIINKRTLASIQDGDGELSPVGAKISSVLETIRDYRGLLLEEAGNNEAQWEDEPFAIRYPDSRQVAVKAFIGLGNKPANKLETELRELVQEMERSDKYRKYASIAPQLFDIRNDESPESGWVIRNFTGSTFTWSLIYLDGLESSLLMMKSAAREP